MDKKTFWNGRAASFKKNAGSDDFLLKKLEINNILELIKENKTILDIGCGNGETLLTICESKNCKGKGIDFSSEMISLALSNKKNYDLPQLVDFEIGNVLDLNDKETFDYIITERCLINIDTEKKQKKCFDKIIKHLKIGGKYIMVESFKEGLEKINVLRENLNLEEISIPWHNTFLSTKVVNKWETSNIKLENIIHFSSLYYFLSRIVNAKIVEETGEELKYDCPINQLGAYLPTFGDYGPAKIYIWKK